MMWGNGWGGVGAGWFVLMHVFWWGMGILLVVCIVRWALGGDFGRRRHEARDPAMDALRERYGRGAISNDEYEEGKRVLEG